MADDGTAALGDLLMRAARTLRRRFGEVLTPWELSPHQARALRVGSSRDGVRLSERAEALRIAPRSATEVADGLQERGLVERAPDPTDRRAVGLTPTAAGGRGGGAGGGPPRGGGCRGVFRPPAGRRPGRAGPDPALADRLTLSGGPGRS